jgi:predicted O-methyltransferase YrrM
MNAQINSIYKSRKVIGRSGVDIPLHSEIDPAEGAFLHQIVSQDSNISKTLEVGCAYGLSSLHVCDALSSRSNPQHIIIDPFQYSHWDGVGIRNLEEAGIRFFKLIEKRSEFALPELLNLREAQFDLVFIDGWHTFDHTLLDCFYATRLLRIGGYLVVDDVGMLPVRRATDYISNYPCYEIHAALGDPIFTSAKRRIASAILALVPAHKRKRVIHPALLSRVFDKQSFRMLAFKKIAEDRRRWNWFPDTF